MSENANFVITVRERKRAWLNRYRESIAEQRRIAEQLEEARSLSTSICVSLNPGRSAPTEIINALYDQRQLTLNQIRVLCCQYIDGLTVPKTADKIGLSPDTVKNYRIKALAAFVVPEPVEVCDDEA